MGRSVRAAPAVEPPVHEPWWWSDWNGAAAMLQRANMPMIFVVRECESDRDAITLSFIQLDDTEVTDLTISRAGDEDYEIEGIPIPDDITNGVAGVIQYLQNPRPDLEWDTGLTHYYMQRTSKIAGLPPPPVVTAPPAPVPAPAPAPAPRPVAAARRPAAHAPAPSAALAPAPAPAPLAAPRSPAPRARAPRAPVHDIHGVAAAGQSQQPYQRMAASTVHPSQQALTSASDYDGRPIRAPAAAASPSRQPFVSAQTPSPPPMHVAPPPPPPHDFGNDGYAAYDEPQRDRQHSHHDHRNNQHEHPHPYTRGPAAPSAYPAGGAFTAAAVPRHPPHPHSHLHQPELPPQESYEDVDLHPGISHPESEDALSAGLARHGSLLIDDKGSMLATARSGRRDTIYSTGFESLKGSNETIYSDGLASGASVGGGADAGAGGAASSTSSYGMVSLASRRGLHGPPLSIDTGHAGAGGSDNGEDYSVVERRPSDPIYGVTPSGATMGRTASTPAEDLIGDPSFSRMPQSMVSELFCEIDADGGGTITLDEFKTFLSRNPGWRSKFEDATGNIVQGIRAASAEHEPVTSFNMMVEDTDYVGPDAKEGAVCNCDFFAEEEEEISIQLDETVYIINDYGDGWTKVARMNGESGVVPTEYIDERTGLTQPQQHRQHQDHQYQQQQHPGLPPQDSYEDVDLHPDIPLPGPQSYKDVDIHDGMSSHSLYEVPSTRAGTQRGNDGDFVPPTVPKPFGTTRSTKKMASQIGNNFSQTSTRKLAKPKVPARGMSLKQKATLDSKSRSGFATGGTLPNGKVATLLTPIVAAPDYHAVPIDPTKPIGYISKFDFSPSAVDEIMLSKGTRVTVLELMDDNWCKVRRQDDETDEADDLAGQEGYVPFQFLDNPMGLTVTAEGIKVGKDKKGTEFISWFNRNRSSAHEVVDETGETLLHLAMERKAPLEVCFELLEECPGAAAFADRAYRKTPFYLAMKWTGQQGEQTALWTTAVTKGILKLCPEAASVLDPEGRSVLHAAVKYSAPVDVVKLLLNAWPNATACNPKGLSPLHYGFLYEADEEVLLTLLEAPGATPINDHENGTTILHLAAGFAGSVAVVRAVLKMWPNAITVPDKHGRTPLHTAVMRSASLNVLRVLLDACPDEGAMIHEDNNGRTPLHNALAEKSSVVCIQELLRRCPRAAHCSDNYGITPLYFALEQGAMYGAIDAVLKAWPDAVQSPALASGWYPLHVAMKQGAEKKTVQLLLRAYSDAAHIGDLMGGHLPLHIAMQSHAPADATLELYLAYPHAVEQETKTGETPLDADEVALWTAFLGHGRHGGGSMSSGGGSDAPVVHAKKLQSLEAENKRLSFEMSHLKEMNAKLREQNNGLF